MSETIESYFVRQSEWSERTFGPGMRTQGIIEHIRKELDEVAANPHDLEEWIDLTMLAMDGFWRHGGDPRTILEHLNAKQAKNFARKWNVPKDGHAVEHVRETPDNAQPPVTAQDDGPPYLSADERGIVILEREMAALRKERDALQAVIGYLDTVTGDDFCEELDMQVAFHPEKLTEVEKGAHAKLSIVYQAAHAFDIRNSCYGVHEDWRKKTIEAAAALVAHKPEASKEDGA